ncbi:putative cca tRNA mitochondrial [Rosellinia necatrix]|uniref:Putative cca tRNA mitochondrial n=1 Tax=Rosellinia necatrix TaxID=77044 RepID=A0A1W2TUL9_ROSNE|nr:putative cca tRNA mitochondrial [Rosellinia necatrix]
MMTAQPATATIELTPKEAQLRDLLLDAAKYVNGSQPTAEPLILRWAGGWVRDRLLGIESHDIDTAINTMTGEAFALKICELCEKPETIEKHGIASADVGNLHKIARNPDKSKHLETTTIRLFGFDVDFVNLRKETYSEDSRNPQVEFGTAEEDALRRDATVNALFYNLSTSRVEDFTTGLDDIKSQLIRTPLEPFQTFMDDPLRVLRLIRFASRLGFTIDPATEKVMGDAKVLDALKLKISRERVGVEVEKMLKGNNPRRALQYIDDLHLYHAIFTDAAKPDMPIPNLSRWHSAYECLSHIIKDQALGSIANVLIQSEEASYHAWVLCALAPWGYVDGPMHTGKGRAPPHPITLAAREGIRAPNKLCELVTAAHKNRESILNLKNIVAQRTALMDERDRFGMAIRSWDARGGSWRLQVLFSILVDAVQRWQPETTSTGLSCPQCPQYGERSNLGTADNHDFLGEWKLFLDHLQILDVLDAPSLKRIIDGTQLAEVLGVKPGKWMANALDVCFAWQFRHPDATDPAGAIDEVKSRRIELDIPPSSRQ